MPFLPRRITVLVVGAALVIATGCTVTTLSLPETGSPGSRGAASAAGAAGAGTGTGSATGSRNSPVTAPGAGTASALGTADNPVRVAIVGDSLTAGGGRTIPEEPLDRNTWMTYAQGDGVDWVGGWAKGGTTVQQMAGAVTPIDDVDVLVLMAGTNDVRLHIGFAASARYYDAIVDTIKPKHVIVAAIPPYNLNPAGAAAYERQLEAYVNLKGWEFVDPWGFARDGLVYVKHTSIDGIHPVTSGYRKVGLYLRGAILQSVATPKAG